MVKRCSKGSHKRINKVKGDGRKGKRCVANSPNKKKSVKKSIRKSKTKKSTRKSSKKSSHKSKSGKSKSH